jgi:hypothetical protein
MLMNADSAADELAKRSRIEAATSLTAFITVTCDNPPAAATREVILKLAKFSKGKRMIGDAR